VEPNNLFVQLILILANIGVIVGFFSKQAAKQRAVEIEIQNIKDDIKELKKVDDKILDQMKEDSREINKRLDILMHKVQEIQIQVLRRYEERRS
jgi:hypothetical protein